MIPIQLDFFETPEESEIAALRKEIVLCKNSLDKVRKGTYARLNILTKEQEELKERQNIIERYICKK